MPSNTLPGLPSQRAGLTTEREDEVTVLLDADRRKICAVNETALAVWVLCDGATDPSEMIEAIRIAAGLPAETASADVDRTLRELTDAGALTWRHS